MSEESLDPKSIAIRPVNRGANTALPAQMVPTGGWIAAKNCIMDETGVVRRKGFANYRTGGTPSAGIPTPFVFDNKLSEYEVPVETFFVWASSDYIRTALVLGSKLLYREVPSSAVPATPFAWMPVRWLGDVQETTTGSDINFAWTAGTRTLTASGISFNLVSQMLLQQGDFFVLTGANGADIVPRVFQIETVNATSVTLYAISGLNGYDFSDFTGTIRGYFARRFQGTELGPTQHAGFPQPINTRSYEYFVDGSLRQNDPTSPTRYFPVMRLDTTALTLQGCQVVSSEDDTSAYTFQTARTIFIHNARMWLGNTAEDTGGYYLGQQRLRWSQPGITTVRGNIQVRVASYQDLPGTGGQIVALTHAQDNMIVFTDDSVFLGKPTSHPGQPFIFSMLDTGKNAIMGPRAFTSVLGGVLYAGRRDCYSIDKDGTVSPMEVPIRRQLLATKWPRKTRMRYLPNDDVLLVSVCTNPNAPPNCSNDTIGVFNSNSKAWSTWEITHFSLDEGFMLNALDPVTFDGAPAYAATLGLDSVYDHEWAMNTSFSSLGGEFVVGGLYITTTVANRIYVQVYRDEYSDLNAVTDARERIQWTLETGDMDLDYPNNDKTLLRASLKINDAGAVARAPFGGNPAVCNFQVLGSTDKGLTWRDLGTVAIGPNQVEEEVTFRLTGDVLRLRFVSNDEIPPVRLEEYVLRVRLRSFEQHRVAT